VTLVSELVQSEDCGPSKVPADRTQKSLVEIVPPVLIAARLKFGLPG